MWFVPENTNAISTNYGGPFFTIQIPLHGSTTYAGNIQRQRTMSMPTVSHRRIQRVTYDSCRVYEHTDFYRKALRRLEQVEAFDAFVLTLAGDEPEPAPPVAAPHPFRGKERRWRMRWLGRRRGIT